MNHINFSNIDMYNTCKGYIYSYELHGTRYIGSTRDVDTRKQEHKIGTKARKTKPNNAISMYGYGIFNLKILDTSEINNIKKTYEN